MTKWGIASTIKADAQTILNFAAYHIELGAHRLYLYLDDANAKAEALLKAHPKVRVITCDDAWWRKRFSKRPEKHQVRQSMNATHAYQRRVEVDWLTHIDVDEFLFSNNALESQLQAIPAAAMTARVRPAEVLSDGDGTAFKAAPPSDGNREATMKRLYPQCGPHLKAGFLSHLAGKIFVRTGAPNVELRIHNAFFDGVQNPGESELPATTLCHLHTQSWDHWMTHFRFRLAQGSYRADLASTAAGKHGTTLHVLLSLLFEEEGETGLRVFFDEVCADTPQLRQRLEAEGLLKLIDLKLDEKRNRVFPQ